METTTQKILNNLREQPGPVGQFRLYDRYGNFLKEWIPGTEEKAAFASGGWTGGTGRQGHVRTSTEDLKEQAKRSAALIEELWSKWQKMEGK